MADLKHVAPVTSTVFSPDGKLILTASRDGIAKLWDIKGKFKAELIYLGTGKKKGKKGHRQGNGKRGARPGYRHHNRVYI